MRRERRAAAGLAGLLALGLLSASGAVAADCGSLQGTAFGSASITSAAAIVPPFSVTGRDPPRPLAVSQPFCRVQGTIKPTTDSGYSL